MAYTEFYCDASAGSNLNGGSSAGSPAVTYTNGGWNSGTGVFTPAAGNPTADGVLVGDFVSVYADGASAPTGYVARVTAVTSTTFTLSGSAKLGSAPATAGTGVTAKVGGAWKGPNGSSGFPLGNVTSAASNAAGDPVRVNFKNNATYSVTAALSTGAYSLTYQGYAASPGDGGKATIDGGTSGASYNLLSAGSTNHAWADCVFQNNGATGSATGVVVNVACRFERVVSQGMRGGGFEVTSNCLMIECQAYDNNKANASSGGGFVMTNNAPCRLVRCISNANAGTNSSGFNLWSYAGSNGPVVVACVAAANGAHGFRLLDSGQYQLFGCVADGNTSHGVNSTDRTASLVLENCVFSSNGGYGVNMASSPDNTAALVKCAYYANGSGQTNNINASFRSGDITLSSAPFADAANGNFAPVTSGLLGSGRGRFTTTAGYSGSSVGYPDVGAVQAASGQASAAFVSRPAVSRRDYRPRVQRTVRQALPVAVTVTVQVAVPVPATPSRPRGQAKVSARRVPPRLIPVPGVTTQVPVPVAVVKSRQARTVTRRPPTLVIAGAPGPTSYVPLPVAGPARRPWAATRYVLRPARLVVAQAAGGGQTVIVSHPRVVR